MNKTIEQILEIWGGTSIQTQYDKTGAFSTLEGLMKQLEHEPSVLLALVPDEDGSLIHQVFDVEYD